MPAVASRVRTGPVSGSGPGRSTAESDRSRIFFGPVPVRAWAVCTKDALFSSTVCTAFIAISCARATCLSVCLSHAGIESKLITVGSCDFLVFCYQLPYSRFQGRLHVKLQVSRNGVFDE